MKHIFIIGATSAIARACARLWAAEGVVFFLVGRHTERLEQVAADLVVRGAAAHTLSMDITDIDSLPAVIHTGLETLGHIDLAFIAHGTLPDQKACEINLDLALREFTNNAVSTIALLTLLANKMEEQGFGVLAVITSVAGERGRQSNYLYGSAKGSVSIFCEGLRGRLFKAGVHLVDIRPGFVATPMTNGLVLPRLLISQPEMVANRIVTGIRKKKEILYAPVFWGFVMLIIRVIPECLWKRIKL